MQTMLDFTEAQADFLIRFLGAPERPPGTFLYQEAAGLLFAVACMPEEIPSSEWLPFIFDDQDPNYADAEEAEACIASLLALYNWIADDITVGRPTLPPYCEPVSDSAANFGSDAPLGLWSAGFGAGYDWLEEAWPAQLPRESDERRLGALLVTLTFFESRELAQRYMEEMEGEPRSLEEWAADVVRMFPEAMRGYADLAASLVEEGDEEDEADLDDDIVEEMRGPNDPCPCGSGMKYKRCCGMA